MSQNRQLALYGLAMLFTAGSAGASTYGATGGKIAPSVVTFVITFCAAGLSALARMGIILNAFASSATGTNK